MFTNATYLINLKRRPDRLAAALARCSAVGITPTVVEAVDGETAPYPRNWNTRLSRGSLGCTLSHRAVLALALDRGAEEVTVFEDDVIFGPDFVARHELFRESIPDNWQGLMLGGIHCRRPDRLRPGVVRCRRTDATHAYTLRGDYIRKVHYAWSIFPTDCSYTFAGLHARSRVYAPERWLCGQGANRSDISGSNVPFDRWWQWPPYPKHEP